MELLIYITWATALFTTFINFFFDKKRTILYIQCITLVAYGTHLFLLWGITSAFLLFAQIGRNIFFSLNFKRNIQTVVLFLFITLYVLIYTQSKSEDPLSYLTLLGTILGTIACWGTNTTFVRILFFISTIPWAFYVIQIWSPFAIVLQATFTLGILTNIVRFDVLKNKNIPWKK